MIVRRLDRLRPSSNGTIAIQIVGTPAAMVTFSDSSNETMACGARSGPGMTRDAPERTAVYGMPHAFAWNIGTTGRTLSRSLMLNTAELIDASECSHVERWLYRTPFGLPVVPVV